MKDLGYYALSSALSLLSLTTTGAEANKACSSLKSTRRTLSSRGLSRVLILCFCANREILLGLTPNRLAACLIDIHCGSLIRSLTFTTFHCSAISRYGLTQLTTYRFILQRVTQLTQISLLGTIDIYGTLWYIQLHPRTGLTVWRQARCGNGALAISTKVELIE